MANTVLIKRSSTANSVPTSGALDYGELALNYTDGNLFFKTSGNSVSVLASNKFVSVTGNVAGGNINTGGAISAAGNITGNYFYGNGSFLTGVTASDVSAAALTGNTLSANVLNSTLTSVGTLGNLSVGGNVSTGNVVLANSFAGGRANTVISSGTTIDSFSTSTYRGAKYLVKAGDGTDYQMSDVLLVHNNTEAFITISTVCSNASSDLFSVAATLSSGTVSLTATTNSITTTTVNLVVTYVKD